MLLDSYGSIAAVGGLHPDDTDELIHRVSFYAEAATQRLEIDLESPDDFIDVIDEVARYKLLGDEALNTSLLVSFVQLWPNGRDTKIPA